MTLATNIMRYRYRIERERKQYNVYQLIEQPPQQSITPLIRIEKDRKCHNAHDKKFDYWMRSRTCNNWSKCKVVTGLMITSYENIFYGDVMNKSGKHLMIFCFSDDKQVLDIYYYQSPNYQTLFPEIKPIVGGYHEKSKEQINTPCLNSKFGDTGIASPTQR